MSTDVSDDLFADLALDDVTPDAEVLGSVGLDDDVPEYDDQGRVKPKPVDQGAEIARLQAEIAAEKARREGREEVSGTLAALREELAEVRGRQSATPTPTYTADQIKEYNERAVNRLSTEPVKVFDEFASRLTEHILGVVRAEFASQAGPALGVGGDVVADSYLTRKTKGLPAKMAEALEAEFRAELATLDTADLLRKPKAERDRILDRAYKVAYGSYAEKSVANRSTRAPANLSGGGGVAAPAARGSLLSQCSAELGYDAEATKRYARNVASRDLAEMEWQIVDGKRVKKRVTDAEKDAKAIEVLADYLDIKTGKRAS